MEELGECQQWTGGRATSNGYPVRWYKGKPMKASRVAFYEAHGYWPKVCRHRCDNKMCVRVEHLVDGTAADNSRDFVERQAWQRSVKRGSARINSMKAEDVRMARSLYQDHGYSYAQLAEFFGVPQSAIVQALG
jgi:hypothetical protein